MIAHLNNKIVATVAHGVKKFPRIPGANCKVTQNKKGELQSNLCFPYSVSSVANCFRILQRTVERSKLKAKRTTKTAVAGSGTDTDSD